MSQKNSKQKSVTSDREDFDYEAFRLQVISGLMRGEDLMGDKGLLKPLIKDFVEGALDAELADHIKKTKEEGENNRVNGPASKTIRSIAGPVDLNYHRDRSGSFEPITVKKRQHQLALGFDTQILELYAMGNSLQNIARHLKKMYGAEMSTARLSEVINATWERVKKWHERQLDACYVVMFVDAVHLNIRRQDGVRKVALYVVYGISVHGLREIIAIYPGQGGESATEWARCLQDLKNRGVKDVFVLCSDGLAGLKEVLYDAFPEANIQRCVVHKIRNCMKMLDHDDSRQVLRQLKEVYTSVNEPEARRKLEEFKLHWKGKYDVVAQLWEKDWTELMACMKLGPALKKITYTTNAIENLNREIRRVTKTKGPWPNDQALLIQLFLSLDRKKDSWHKKVHQWASIHRELVRDFGERFTKHIS